MFTRSQIKAIESAQNIRQFNADVLALDPFNRDTHHQRKPHAPIWAVMPHLEPHVAPLTVCPEGWRPRGRSSYERRKHSGRPAPKPLPPMPAAIRDADLKAMGKDIAERQLAMLGLPSSGSA